MGKLCPMSINGSVCDKYFIKSNFFAAVLFGEPAVEAEAFKSCIGKRSKLSVDFGYGRFSRSRAAVCIEGYG